MTRNSRFRQLQCWTRRPRKGTLSGYESDSSQVVSAACSSCCARSRQAVNLPRNSGSTHSCANGCDYWNQTDEPSPQIRKKPRESSRFPSRPSSGRISDSSCRPSALQRWAFSGGRPCGTTWEAIAKEQAHHVKELAAIDTTHTARMSVLEATGAKSARYWSGSTSAPSRFAASRSSFESA